jgi:chemotaxis signal transduction protein/ABC-type nitrate/sulfonate/bicarbonate transport system substrate-binding protein
MPGWNPVQQALEKGEVDAAFILAPIAMDLFSVDVPIKLVLFAHKNGSICVRNKKGGKSSSLREFFKGKNFYIPHFLSIHHMLSDIFLREVGLTPGVTGNEGVDAFFEVVPPIKMPEFLAKNFNVGGYTVAEPLGTKAINAGSGTLMFLSGELWEDHPCCVVILRDEIIEQHPDAVYEFTDLLVKAGKFIAEDPKKAAEIAVWFLDPEGKLGLKEPVLEKVLKEPKGITTDDLFPVIEDLDQMQRYMSEEMGIGTIIDLEKFVDTRFAERACGGKPPLKRTFNVSDASKAISEIIRKRTPEYKKETVKDREGKYLIFTLNNQEYAIGSLSAKEIIGMMPIRPMPQTPPFIKGIINLRGQVIPVIDLRLKFGMEELEYNERTCIIVLEVGENSKTFQVGIVVDSVSEVINIKNTEIADTPSFGVEIDTDYILGMANMDKGVKILVDPSRLFTEKEGEMIGNSF